MRSTIVLLTLWLLLFGAVAGIGVARSHPTHLRYSDPIRDALIAMNQAKLNETPSSSRVSQGALTGADALRLVPDKDIDVEISSAVSNYALAHRDMFIECRRSVMSRSSQPKEFFDLSFGVIPGAGQRQLIVKDVKYERGTIEISSKEQECIMRTIRDANISISQDLLRDVSDRIMFRICLRPLGQKPYEREWP